MTAHSEALDVIHQKVARGDLVVRQNCLIHYCDENISFLKQCDAMEQYQTEVNERIDVYAGKTARQKYAKDKRYLDFHASIWVCCHYYTVATQRMNTTCRKCDILTIQCLQLMNLSRKVTSSCKV